MGAVETTYTFTATDTITSTKMNNIIDQTVMTSSSIIGTTLEISSGKLKVAAGGITSNELSTGCVTSTAILDNTIVNADINSSAAIDLSKLGTGALPTTITIATANITDSNVTTAKIADAAITAPKLSGAQTGTAPVFGCRAWANFNAQANTDVSGTYARTSSTTVSITASNHGLIAGNQVFLDFTVTTGTAPFDGIYQVDAVTDSNNFTVISSASTSSTGTVALKRKTIRASGNVSCVSAAAASPVIPPTSSISPADGYYILNFSTALPNANFSVSGSLNLSGTLASTSGLGIFGGFGFNEKCAYVTTFGNTGAASSFLYSNAMVIG